MVTTLRHSTITRCCLLVFVCLWTSDTYAYESLKGLAFESVSFSVEAPIEYRGHLRKRAIEQFLAAGLVPRKSDSLGEGSGISSKNPGLLLTLSLSEAEECKNYYYYEEKLELLELAVFQRTKREEWFPSWEAGIPNRVLVREKSLESMEASQAILVNDFIYHYYLANPTKLRPGIRITPMPNLHPMKK